MSSTSASSSSSKYYTGLCYLSKTVKSVLGRSTLSATVRKEMTGAFESCHILDIIRPSKATISVRISVDPQSNHTVAIWNGQKHVIPHVISSVDIKHAMYTHPTLNTKANPHYAAAIIIGNRMISFVWFDGCVYIADTSSMLLSELYDMFVRNTIASNLSYFCDESVTHVADCL